MISPGLLLSIRTFILVQLSIPVSSPTFFVDPTWSNISTSSAILIKTIAIRHPEEESQSLNSLHLLYDLNLLLNTQLRDGALR